MKLESKVWSRIVLNQLVKKLRHHCGQHGSGVAVGLELGLTPFQDNWSHIRVESIIAIFRAGEKLPGSLLTNNVQDRQWSVYVKETLYSSIIGALNLKLIRANVLTELFVTVRAYRKEL
eukprot:4730174-Amphidinium_carterae.1